MAIEYAGNAGSHGQWKIYKDSSPGPHLMGFKGTTYMGSEIIDKDGNPIKNLKAGDKFFINNCVFGNREYVATPCHKADKDAKIVLTSYGRKLQGIPDDRPKDGLMGVSETIVTGLEYDPEHGWLAMGYSHCPYKPEDM